MNEGANQFQKGRLVPLETSAIVQRPSSDYLTALLRLVERDHQRITDLEHAVAELRQELADEIQRRRVLSSRVDRGECER